MISHKNTHTKYLLMSAIQSYLFSMRAQMIHYDWITPFVLMRWIGIGFGDNALYKTWFYLVNTYNNFSIFIYIYKSEWCWYFIIKTITIWIFPCILARKVFSNLTDEALHIAHDVYLTNGGNLHIVVLCLLPVMLRGVSYRKNKWVILSEYNFCFSVQTINSFGWLS